MKHTMSMYQTKDAMIDAMQAEIDSLEAQLTEAREDSERLKNVLGYNIAENTRLYGNPEENGAYRTYYGPGFIMKIESPSITHY